MEKFGELRAALAVVAVAVSADFAAGRELAAFYAQMGAASWLGALASGLAFGGIVALLARLARGGRARNLFALLCESPGGAMGRLCCALCAAIVLLAGWSLTAAAARLGALALPLRRAELFGGAFALLAAALIALRGPGALCAAGAAFVGLFALYELALLCFARLHSLPGTLFVLECKLDGSIGAALGFALLHACMCASLAAGAVLRVARGSRPGRLGLCSGCIFALLLLVGNGALRVQMDEILALELPFVALASDWGHAGFWLSAGAMYLAAVTSLAGLFCALLPVLNSNNSRV